MGRRGYAAPITQKRCGACGDVKPIFDFHRCKTAKDGYQYRCRECKKRHQKAFKTPRKLCKCCEIPIPLHCFNAQRGTPDGLIDECMGCVSRKRLGIHKTQGDAGHYESYMRAQPY